jgi:hypothetical protein
VLEIGDSRGRVVGWGLCLSTIIYTDGSGVLVPSAGLGFVPSAVPEISFPVECLYYSWTLGGVT